MDELLMIIKKDSVENNLTYATTRLGRQCYQNKELADIVLVELIKLDFKRDDIVDIDKLENLQVLIKKGFNLRFYSIGQEFGLSVTFWTKNQGGTGLISARISKQEKISELFTKAESWAEDLIEQFNSDKENSL